MERFMHSDFRLNTNPERGADTRVCGAETLLGAMPRVLPLFFLFAAAALAQLPDGPGKEETQRLCSQCHELERSISPRQDRDGWQATLDKMSSLGMKASAQEVRAALDYLAKNYPGEAVPRININKARAIELESGLTLRRSEAAAVIQYREKNGPFKSIDDLKKVPGIDTAKIEAKKDRLVF
jgi:competence protein ComEA